MFVVGGSYKSFYLNEAPKVNKVDLIVFNQKIFYEFDYEQEYLSNPVVSNELISLNNRFKCPIVVYGESNLLGKKEKCFIICVNQKLSVVKHCFNVYLFVKNRLVMITNKLRNTNKKIITICFADKSTLSFDKLNNGNNLFISTKLGVFRLQNGKIYKKFRKYCYFRLYFYKKMI